MSRSITYTIASVLIVLVALFAIPFFIPWAKYKDMAITKAYEASGYVIAIEGDVSGGILPVPHIKVGGVSVATGKDVPPFVKADSIAVDVALMPLLSGKVQVGAISLNKPVATIDMGSKNWVAQKPQAATPEPAPATEGTTTNTAQPAVSIGRIEIADGDFTIVDPAKPQPTKILVPDLQASVPSLSGPFAVKGKVIYGAIPLDIDATLGDLTKDNFDVDGELAVADGAATAKAKGTLGLKPAASGKLAIDAAIKDVAALAKVGIGVPAAAQGSKISGVFEVADGVASLQNGVLESPMADADINARVAGLNATDKSVEAQISFKKPLDVDALIKALPKSDNAAKPDENAEGKDAPKTSAAFLPESLVIPANLTVNAAITAPSITYKGKKTGALSLAAMVGKAGSIDAKISLADIPGGGSFAANGGLKAVTVTPTKDGTVLKTPVLDLAYQLQVNDVKTTAVDWLAVAKADAFDNPNIPRAINMNGSVRVAGNTVAASFGKVAFGKTTASGEVRYTKTAPRPTLGVKLVADAYDVSGGAASSEKPSASGAAVAAAKTVVSPPSLPELPFDLNFDVTVGQVKTQQIALADVQAQGAIAGQSITLKNVSARPNGGAVAVSGKIDDVSALKGVDMNANLTTSDVRALAAAFNKADALPATVKGALSSRIKLKGDRTNMAVDAGVENQGFTVGASGVLADLLNPILPGALAVHIQHPNFASAVRTFAPDWSANAGGGRGLDVRTDVKLGSGAYELNNLKAQLGTTDLSGNLQIKTGAVPSISGSLASSMLAIGDLVGVKAQPKSAMRLPTDTNPLVQLAQVSNGSSPWSSNALPTDALRKMGLDINLNAKTLTYGTWVLNNADFTLKLAGGKLSAAPLKAGLFGGSLDMDLTASATSADEPLNVALKGSASNIDMGSFMSALMSQNKRSVQGRGTIDFTIQGAGTSSASLVRSLDGKVDVATKDLSVLGIDLEKLGKSVDGAVSGGWQDALAGGMSGFGLDGGVTGFQDMTHSFPIQNGVLSIADLKLDTRSSLVRTTTNGMVNFPAFAMDVTTDMYAVKASKAVANIRLSGPLNAPQKSIDSSALKALLGNKAQKQIDKVIQSDKVQKILNKAPGLGQLLGVQSSTDAQQPQPQQEPAPQQPAPAPAAPAKPVEQQVIEGLFNSLAK